MDGACSSAVHLWVGLGPRPTGAPTHGALATHGVHVRSGSHTPHGALTPSCSAPPSKATGARALQQCKACVNIPLDHYEGLQHLRQQL